MAISVQPVVLSVNLHRMPQTSGETRPYYRHAFLSTYGVIAAIPAGGDTVTTPFTGPEGKETEILLVEVTPAA